MSALHWSEKNGTSVVLLEYLWISGHSPHDHWVYILHCFSFLTLYSQGFIGNLVARIVQSRFPVIFTFIFSVHQFTGFEESSMTEVTQHTHNFRKRKWQPTPVFSPGESHGRRNLVGYCPLSCKELDKTEAT